MVRSLLLIGQNARHAILDIIVKMELVLHAVLDGIAMRQNQQHAYLAMKEQLVLGHSQRALLAMTVKLKKITYAHIALQEQKILDRCAKFVQLVIGAQKDQSLAIQ